MCFVVGHKGGNIRKLEPLSEKPSLERMPILVPVLLFHIFEYGWCNRSCMELKINGISRHKRVRDKGGEAVLSEA